MNKLGWGLALTLIAVACGGSTDDDNGGTSSGGSSSGGASSGSTPAGDPKDYVTFDATKFCAVLLCPGATPSTLSQEECIATYKAARVPPSCKTQIETANCQSPGSIVRDCFPACDPTVDKPTCHGGDRVTSCSDEGKVSFTFECNGVCEKQKKTWAGVCGTEFQGQVSSDGTAKCFCK